MRIGIVTTWFERGAAHVSRQYASLLKERHGIFIYARGGEQQARNKGDWDHHNVTWGDRHWAKSKNKDLKNKNLEDFKRWVEDNKLDVVFFNEEHIWSAVLLCNEMGVKTGAYVDYYTKETVPLFGVYDFLICNTKRHYSVFKWHPQSYFIPWGTDVALFKPNSYGLAESGVLSFFHSAGMNPQRKGTDKVIRAFNVLSSRYEKVRLIIHTQVPINSFFPELETVMGRLKSGGTLLCVEETIQSPGLYYRGDVYVYPTTLEGIGLTVAEALASGLPVVVSDNGPMNEFVDQANGRLVKIKRFYQRYFDHYYWPLCEVDEHHLLQSMEYYIKNVDRIREFKRNARKSAEKRMDWRKNLNVVLDAFEKSIIIKDKTAASKKARRLEWIKNHSTVLLLYKIKTLKLDSLIVFCDLIKKSLKKTA